MAFGALAMLWGMWLLPMHNGLLDTNGLTPTQPSVAHTWGIFEIWNSNEAMLIGVIVLVVSAIALLVGWHSRLAAVVVYLAPARAKLPGESWENGTAVSYAFRIEDMQRVPLPQWFVTNALAMNVMTWGAIAIELAVGVLVWFPRCRP